MKKITESENYEISFDYEKVPLMLKQTGKTILIGEFYGDPCAAIISKKEDFCVIGGEGIIIYYLNEPFFDYNGVEKTGQWKTWGRDNLNKIVWVDKIEQIDDNTIKVTSENNEEFLLTI